MINNYLIVIMNLFAYLDWQANAGLQNRVIQKAVVKKLHLENNENGGL